MQKYDNCNNLTAFFIHLSIRIANTTAMKTGAFKIAIKNVFIVLFAISTMLCSAQDDAGFWSRVRFGGGLGVAFGTGYTDITVAPGALYEFNQYVGVGIGLQGTYINQKNYFTSFLYGGSVIGVLNPIPEIQLSAEVEQLRVNLDVEDQILGNYHEEFWNTGLFLGAGYRMENVTIGGRYNVLFDEDDFVYSAAFMPFIRVYF